MASSQQVNWNDTDFETSQSDCDENQPPCKKQRQYCTWEFTKAFPTKEVAVEFIKKLNDYKFNKQYRTSDGDILKYVCKVDRNCSSRYRIILKSSSKEVTVEKSVDTHDHMERKLHGIEHNTKQEIILLMDQSVLKPNAILKALQEKGIRPPEKSQLNRFLLSCRKKEAPPILSLGSLESHCLQYSKAADSLDEAYILHSEFDYDKKWFGICCTTKRLLQISQLSAGVQADATYKNSWEGYPVLITGVTDKNKTFHPTLIGLTTGETSRDYGFIFEALKRGHQNDYRPKVLLADCAEAITNGFAAVYGPDFVRGHCWFHVMKNVDQRRNLVKDKTIWNTLRKDISDLQLARNEAEFQAASELWSKKYRDDPATCEFQKYFYDEYVRRCGGWYEGLFIGYPTTNNGLESTNRWIKSQGTLRNRLPMAQMLLYLMQQASNWSAERDPNNPNCKEYAMEPSVTIKLSKTAFQWVTKKPDMRFKTDPQNKDDVHYFVSASGQPKLKDADVNKYLRMKERCSWRSFDGYVAGISRLWMVTFNKLNWKSSKCTCPVFLKDNICKHLIGIANKHKLYEFPPNAKEVPLGVKRKRGRIPIASRALIVD